MVCFRQVKEKESKSLASQTSSQPSVIILSMITLYMNRVTNVCLAHLQSSPHRVLFLVLLKGSNTTLFLFFAPFTSLSITSEINQKATLVAIVLLHCTRICMANKADVLKLVFSANPLVNPTSGFYTEGNTLVVHPPPKPPIICHISSTKSMANYIFMRQLCHLSISNRFVNTLLNTFFLSTCFPISVQSFGDIHLQSGKD